MMFTFNAVLESLPINRAPSTHSGIRPPTVTAGAIGTAIAIASLFIQPELTHGVTLTVVPAVTMIIALLGGWIIGGCCAAMVTLAAMMDHIDPAHTALCTSVAVVCSEMLRRDVIPPAVVAVALVSELLSHLFPLTGNPAPLEVKMLVTALTNATVNVALATAVLVIMPRYSAMWQPRCRLRCGHIVFAVLINTTSLSVIHLLAFREHPVSSHGGHWNSSDITAIRLALLMVFSLISSVVITRRLERISLRLPQQYARLRGSNVILESVNAHLYQPLREIAGPLLASLREANRFKRDSKRHRMELVSVQEESRRLRSSIRDAKQSLLHAHETLKRQSEQFFEISRSHEDAQARYRTLMEHSPDVMIFADDRAIIQAVSRSATILLGLRPTALVGQPLRDLIPDDHVTEHPLELAWLRQLESASNTMDVSVKTASSGPREVSLQVQAFTVSGARNYAIRLRDGEHMKKVFATLERAKNMTASAHRSRDLFIAAISHELRTPLHGLIATLDMLRVTDQSSADFEQQLAVARISARSLLNIANDVLDLSRIDSGHFHLERRVFSLEAVLRELVGESRARAESLGLRMETRIISSLPPSFIGDPTRLKQILGNLISNALKFTHSGGVSLEVQHDGSLCIIDVSDTGEGIPVDKQELIFESFVQLKSASARRGTSGAGLGLSISRRLAEAMGGKLVLRSSYPTGSTFRLSVPLETSREILLDEQSQRIFANPRGRILVVEDNPSNRYVVEALLNSLDCPMTIVDSGAGALELLDQREFDLILMDCEMPEMDGYETTRRVRRILKRRIPIIAMTANVMAEDRARCMDAGMDDFLSKPFGRAALNSILCKWLEPSRQRSADLKEQLAALPVLDTGVFEELQQGLRWKLRSLQQICQTFVTSGEKTCSMIEDAGGLDHRVLLRQLHTLLGSAGMVGARQVEHLASRIQASVKTNHAQAIAGTSGLLRLAIERFKREFEQRLESSGNR